MKFSFVMPVHNEATILEAHVRLLEERFKEWPGSAVIMVNNGSRDASAKIMESIKPNGSVKLVGETIPTAGIGYAYHRGMELALEKNGTSQDHWIILSAADLPFKFTDLDEFLKRKTASFEIAIGSKAHPDTVIAVQRLRQIMSFSYRLIRRALLGMKTKDSQGSFFIRSDRAAALLPVIESRDFFYSTELVAYAERDGITVEEIPVVYIQKDPEGRKSTVKPFKSSWNMLKKIFWLRRKLSQPSRVQSHLSSSTIQTRPDR